MIELPPQGDISEINFGYHSPRIESIYELKFGYTEVRRNARPIRICEKWEQQEKK